MGTYSNYSALTCIPCVYPCATCINEYSCLTCVSNYMFYESICVLVCPNNTWLYDRICHSECNKYKDYDTGLCLDQCPIYKVAQNGVCLNSCPVGYYVSKDRVCLQCDETCKDLFKGEMQLVAVDEFRLVIYFNQRTEIVNNS